MQLAETIQSLVGVELLCVLWVHRSADESELELMMHAFVAKNHWGQNAMRGAHADDARPFGSLMRCLMCSNASSHGAYVFKRRL